MDTRLDPDDLNARCLSLAELHAVNGGYYVSTVDISKMPDRGEVCGTMWYMGQLLKRLGIR